MKIDFTESNDKSCKNCYCFAEVKNCKNQNGVDVKFARCSANTATGVCDKSASQCLKSKKVKVSSARSTDKKFFNYSKSGANQGLSK